MLQTEFIEKFNGLNNMVADVHIKHLLYGSQKIKKCVLHPFVDGGRIGLVINGESIYITMDELCDVSFSGIKCVVESEIMELYIKLL